MHENSASTSGRPGFHMVGLINDPGTNMAAVSYSKLISDQKAPNSLNTSYLDDVWRRHRRATHEILTPRACENYLPIQYAEAYQLMFELLNHPQVRGSPITSLSFFSYDRWTGLL